MKEVYLTIDDCPSKDFRKKIDFLKKKKIPAVLFCLGRLMEDRPEDVVYAIKRGFIIGNHSYSHPFFNLISLKRAYSEIKKTDEIIDELYRKARVKRKEKFFRFPYGNKGGSIGFWAVMWTRLRSVFSRNVFFGKNREKKIQNFLRKLGYKQPKFKDINYSYFSELGLDKDLDVFWTYDLEEYRIGDLKKIFSLMEKKNNRQGGSLGDMESADIVLIHDHDRTTDNFFKIIEKMIEMKIKFRRIQ